MAAQFQWLNKRTPRSVDNLRLWGENPRLDPEDTYLTIKDFATEMTSTKQDRENFIRLARSITNYGFVPGDPVVVWQNPNNKKYYVAEGNRRVVVLKLLRDPQKAPKSIKSIFLNLSNSMALEEIEKISVSVAPNFDDSEWYISQRNSTSSLQTSWSREQQLRWIVDLYDKYEGNIDVVKEKAGLTESEIEGYLRAIALKEFTKEVKDQLSEDDYSKATSHRFPISTLERFLNNKKVREEWGIEFSNGDVILTKDNSSFLKAYAELIKRMCLPNTDENRIDSRTINTSKKIEEDYLPTFPPVHEKKDGGSKENLDSDNEGENSNNNKNKDSATSKKKKSKPLKNYPFRIKLVLPFYDLKTDSYRLDSLFKELKKIPIRSYPNSVAAAIRIFLDLAVLKYIETENLKSGICGKYKKDLNKIILRLRLEFIKNKVAKENQKTIGKLLNHESDYSLDVLNGYVHGHTTHYLNYTFLNRFWDFLFPLFKELLEIEEQDW